MFNTRWIKLLRDLQMTPWRISLMLLALAIGVFGFTTMFSSYIVLTREVSRNYLATNPASATLQVENINTELMEGIRRFPGINQAQASTTLNADLVSYDGTIRPLLIFSAEDFNQININKMLPEAGAWPPLPNTLLLERNSLAQEKMQIGNNIKIRMNNGELQEISVSGTVHDSAMPVPSMAIFAYANVDTLKSLGLSPSLTDLKITVIDKVFNSDAIENIASQLAIWIQKQGHKVSRIKIPQPGEHPHQRIIFAVTGALLIFSGITLILGSIITATIIDGFMARQVRQIGVMKAIGASTSQIIVLYLMFVLILSIIATSIGVPAGIATGKALCRMVLINLNFDSQNLRLSTWINISLMAVGILLPLFFTSIPILKASRISVQSALTSNGVSRHAYPERKLGSDYLFWLYRLPGVDRTLMIAIRNSLRRKVHLVFLVVLLSSAGSMFLSGLNVRNASQQHLIDAAAERHYDLEVNLSDPEDPAKITAIINAVEGVKIIEPWSISTVARHRVDGIDVERTYADGAHGALLLTAIPDESHMITVKTKYGHWLDSAQNSNDGKVVFNRKALEYFPDKNVGDEVLLGVAGTSAKLSIVGIADQKMTGGMAYVSTETYKKITNHDGRYKKYRIVMSDHNEEFVSSITKKIESALSSQNIKVKNTLTESRLRREIDGHFTVIVNSLLFTSVLMAAVGVFSLGVAMSIDVIERTVEFGIMKTIGASSRQIMRNVVAEALFISLLSWILAVALSLLLSTIVGSFLGKLIFDEAFPLTPSLTAPWIWLSTLIVGAVLASVYPARKAIGMNIRESFNY